jgi:crotonobetainyl-CoA:carnitine CoA-transferase CaiB-like acyl-CoA transferase
VASGPLDGIKVLEFTQIIAGPFGCQNLADMGASVIKVEPPEGEPWRQFAQFMPGESKLFQSLNRGKQSLVLQLTDPQAQAVVHRLVPEMDVVVINYRPDVAARLQIDYDTLRALRPDLIYVDNTAFGRKGPWADRPGYDIVAQAVSGLMASEGKINEDSQAPSAISSVAVADYATGIVIPWAVCAALFHREKSGEGQLIETTLLGTALAVQNSQIFDLPAADAETNQTMERVAELREAGAPYPDLVDAYGAVRGVWSSANIYYRGWDTKDGAVVIGALSPALWAKVRKALGTDFLGMADPDADPNDAEWMAHEAARVRLIEEDVRQKTTDEWLAIFEREGVPAGAVRFPEELLDDPQVAANDMLVPLEHDLSGPQRQVAPMIKMSATPLAAQSASPPLGRDTDAILRSAGYAPSEIDDLRRDGVVG